MIRRAAFQKVILVENPPWQRQQQQSRSTPPTTTFAPSWHPKLGGGGGETSSKVVFHVPIHLIKRQRAVLVKDIERIAPEFESIRTEQGNILFHRHRDNKNILHSNSNKNNQHRSDNKDDNYSSANHCPNGSTANMSDLPTTSSSLPHPHSLQHGHQQQQVTFIPVQDDRVEENEEDEKEEEDGEKEESAWYIQHRINVALPPRPSTSRLPFIISVQPQVDEAIKDHGSCSNIAVPSDQEHLPHRNHVVGRGQKTRVDSAGSSQSNTLAGARSRMEANVAILSQQRRDHGQDYVYGYHIPSSTSLSPSSSSSSSDMSSALPESTTTTTTTQMPAGATARATTRTGTETVTMTTSTEPLTSSDAHRQVVNDAMQGQLLELARTLLTVLDTGVRDADDKERIRCMARSALTGFVATPLPSDDDNDDNDNSHVDDHSLHRHHCHQYQQQQQQQQQQHHGLITPETTPVSTPVFTGNAQREPNSPKGDRQHQKEEEEQEEVRRQLSTPMLSVVRHHRSEDSSDSIFQTPLHQTRHLRFASEVATVRTANTLSSATSGTAPQTAATKKDRRSSASLMQLKNPFLAIFRKNTISSVDDNGDNDYRNNNTGDIRQRNVAEEAVVEGRTKKNTWFMTGRQRQQQQQQRQRSNTISQENERQGTTINTTSASASSSSPPLARSGSGSGSESSAYVSASSSVPSSPTRPSPSSRRFPSPLHLPLWTSSRSKTTQSAPSTPIVAATAATATTMTTTVLRTTTPVAATSNSNGRSVYGTLGSPTYDWTPRTEREMYPYTTRQQCQVTRPFVAEEGPGPASHMTTGSFLDSVSDDDSDDDMEEQEEEVLQRTRGSRSASYLATRPYRHSYCMQQRQQQRHCTQVQPREEEWLARHQAYDSDSMSDEDYEEEGERDEDEDEDEDDDDHDGTEDQETEEEEMIRLGLHHHHRQYSSQQDPRPRPQTYYAYSDQQAQQLERFNSTTLEGYVHQYNDDDIPPPSYYSLIQQDQMNRSCRAAAAESVPIITQPAISMQRSSLVLHQLLDLLHQFEDHVQNQFKTPAFRSSSSCPSSSTMTSPHRQLWLNRNPQTVVSFAYVLIELEQTGLLPGAMCATWTGWNLHQQGQSTTTTTCTPASSSSSSSPSALTPVSCSNSVEMEGEQEFSMSEQDWLTMAGNASTQSHLAKALIALEQCCVYGMDQARWHGHCDTNDLNGHGRRRERWIAQVQSIITAFA